MKDFLEFAAERYSVRKYLNLPVEREKIDRILSAANLAPTACNYQPQKIYVVTDGEKLSGLAEISPCTFDAPVVFVIGYDSERSAKGRVCAGHDFGDTDAAIVCTHMMLEAHQLGLGSCWVGMFNEDCVRSLLCLPENIRIRELMPMGYPAKESSPSPLHTKYRAMDEMVEFI